MSVSMPARGAPPATATGATPTGSIYDLGYRHYDGPRLGRRHAVWALYAYSLRSTFGIGRSGRSKVVPFGLAFLALLPALIAVGITALVNQVPGRAPIESPIQYGTYLGYSETLLLLFCAAQAPELVGRDQRYTVLPLYFSRALSRADYALAKLAALWSAIVIVYFTPQALMFAGSVLAAKDVPEAFAQNVSFVPPIIAVALIVSLVLGAISVALASSTPRRAYATVSVIAAFIVPPIVAAVIADLASGSTVASIVVLLDPLDLLDGANAWFFGWPAGNAVLGQAGIPHDAFVPVLAFYVAVATLATVRRYVKVPA